MSERRNESELKVESGWRRPSFRKRTGHVKN